MASAPMSPQQPSPEGASPSGGASPVIRREMKLAMLAQSLKELEGDFPNAKQGIQMMQRGLQMIQSSAAAASAPQSVPAPPR